MRDDSKMTNSRAQLVQWRCRTESPDAILRRRPVAVRHLWVSQPTYGKSLLTIRLPSGLQVRCQTLSPGDEAPSHLIRDRDVAFGPAYTHRIRAMGIGDHPTAPRSPWQNSQVERLIGSIRRESLDHLVVFDEVQLRRILKSYAFYYNQVRTHLSLHKNAPDFGVRKMAISQQNQFSAGFIIDTFGFSFE